ncbi:Uncharacterised protein [Mycobacteroides abscessus subsp. abscessus]|nr:Uncharacterised protein [Mycobacteroides abscessus subsp. abscessus]
MHRIARVTETRQRLETVQGHHKFRFVVAISVVTYRRVERHTRRLFAREPVRGLLGAWVRLQGKWLVGGQHLEQEG